MSFLLVIGCPERMEREDDMNYITIGEFGNKVCISLTKIMGSEYEAVYKEVTKNNGVCLHSVMISKRGSNVAPSIYIDELYEDYRGGRALGEIVKDILNVYRQNAKEVRINMDFFTRFETVKDRILYKLINRERNTRLLEEIPYVKWNDLAIVFYYLFEEERFGKATILIRNTHMSMWDVDLEDLYKNARSNMLKLQPEDFMPIGHIINDIILDCNNGSNVGIRAVGILHGEDAVLHGEGVVMYFLSSESRYFGAAVLLYSKSIKELAERLERNLIILPSSIHEVLLIPDDNVAETAFYRDMVRDVNDTQLEPEEILSYNIYYYDRFTEQITIKDADMM
ncbi:MAG: hypothetical protein J1E98_03395 [Lachnospiraceae bacterium]|nr:hypothetical protein [Lachnospiraceae bacterium]